MGFKNENNFLRGVKKESIKSMKNTKFYFSHDYEAASDPKIICMLSDYGGLGYGLYWRIIELLHKETLNILPRNKFLFLALAKQMLVEEDKVKAFIDDCIKKYELFGENEQGLFSERVFTNLKKMEENNQQLSNIRKEIGRIGGLKSGEVRRKKKLDFNE